MGEERESGSSYEVGGGRRKGGSALLLLMVSMIVANSKEMKWETGGEEGIWYHDRKGFRCVGLLL